MLTDDERAIFIARDAARQTMQTAIAAAYDRTWAALARGDRSDRPAVYEEYEAAVSEIRDDYAASLATIPGLPSAADADRLMQATD